jgi:hypothetical protein
MTVRRWSVGFFVVLLSSATAGAQGTRGPRVSDSSVGYIDSAIPGDIFRFRFDSAYDNPRPTRAEFFYPKGGPSGPGLPDPEPRVDYQELSAYLEMAASDRLSGFINLPTRFLNPEVNPNHAGFSDMDTGFKYAFLRTDRQVATLQFRTYIPTGDSHRGLGTHHVSLEPALLFFDRLADRLALESELRYWASVGGTDFAGDIIRYGIGLRYDAYQGPRIKLMPVIEVVGWTVLDGKELVVPPSGAAFVQEAGGDSILNIKFGVRMRMRDRADLYVGYGRPLTGDRWYSDIVRVEFRMFY